MHFTIEDYKKIERWLKENSVKDTEFPETSELYPNEYLTIIQQGINKKVKLNSLLKFILNNTDSDLDITSTNPVQNQAVTKAIYELQNRKIIKIVDTLPSIDVAESSVIYILLAEVGEDNNLFTEWIKVNNTWEKVGEFKADIDLTPYLKIEDSPFGKGEGKNSAVLKGGNNVASSNNSSAFGLETKANGEYSHSEGRETEANGNYSHAEGFTTITYNEAEHASGKYNNSVEKTESNTDADATLFSIGIGESKKKRKNAFEVKQNGDIYVEGFEKPIQTKLTELLEENERLKERIDEQDVFIEDLEYHKLTANSDNRYPDISVGLADNLSGVDVVDSEVNFRRSGGGAISDGVARIEAIKGNSVVWNQCFGNGATNKDYLKWEGNKATINGEFDADNVSYDIAASGAKHVAPITNHKYFVEIDVISGTISGGIIVHYLPFADKSMNISENQLSVKTFVSSTLTSTYYFARTIRAGVIATNLKVMYRVTDLTKMFGAGNEPTTIEEFYARIPMGVDLNAYNEGEVIHLDVQSVESQGFNAWDEEWEVINGSYISSKNYIRVIPNATYYTNVALSNDIRYYDKDYNRVGSTAYAGAGQTFIVPANVQYMKFSVAASYGTTYNHDICINISDASINGKYFPYVKRTEDLSIIRKYFPDGMKSAGTAHDEIRYNKATQKWEKVVGIGVVDMGSLNWSYNSTSGQERFFTIGIKDVVAQAQDSRKANLVTSRYITDSFSSLYSHISDKLIAQHSSGQVVIYDSTYTDAASFKASLQGVILYYELAEPIVTELDAEDQFKDLDYQVWNCGTEKAIAEGKSAPLAADITYGFNAIGKIKELEKQMATLMTQMAQMQVATTSVTNIINEITTND